MSHGTAVPHGRAKTAVLALVASLAVAAIAADSARFEVASIKPAPPLTPGRSTGTPLGVRMDRAQASFGGMTLAALISYAYGVKLAQISGPDWLTTQRFDIVAKLPAGGSTERVPEMMQALLAERFGMKVRRDSKEFSVYALAPARTGLKLTPRPEGFDPKANSDQMALPILSLTLLLEQMVGMPVVDETGIQGQYLFPAQAIRQAMIPGKAAASSGMVEAAEPAGPSVAALLLPLGMRLERKRANLPLLVVESMRQTPTED